MTTKTALELVAAEQWAIAPEAELRKIMAIAARELELLAKYSHEAAPLSGDRETGLEQIEAVATGQGRTLDPRGRIELRNGVAILRIVGPMFRYANIMTEHSGACSIGSLAKDFAGVMASDQVRAVLLSIDSPGGQVSGTNELAEQIYAARMTGAKPIKAYVGARGASGAYWLASACDEIVCDATATLGSIGVIMSFRDSRDRDAELGIESVSIVSSNAPLKAPDHRTESGLGALKRTVDQLAGVFVSQVARNRGVSEEEVNERFGRGWVEVGAAAVSAGLADRLGSFEGLLAEMAGGTAAETGGIDGTTKGGFANMSTETKAPASEPEAAAAPQGESTPAATVETGSASVAIADTVAAVRERCPQAAAALTAVGAEAERTRILEIQALALPGDEKRIAAFVADGKTTPAEAALALRQVEVKAGPAELERLRQSAPEPVGQPAEDPKPGSSGGAGEPGADAPLEERAKAEWDSDSSLRAEFGGSFESYLALREAEDGGRVKVLRGAGH